MVQRIGEYAIDWGDELTESHRQWESQHGTIAKLPKRTAAPKDDEDAAQKRARVADGDGPIGDDEMKGHFKKNNIHKVPLPMQYSISRSNVLTSGSLRFLSSKGG